MTQKRKRCDKQFKMAAARIVLGGEMKAVELASELEIKDSTLKQWAQEHEKVGDITYIGTGEGWLYLAAVIDAFRRKVVGWSMSGRITEKLVTDALEQAVGRENPPDDFSLVFHNDQGSQHTSRAFQRCLAAPWNRPIHVAAGQPMGRRARGILLQDAQARAGERQGLQDEGGGEAERVQAHRVPLQQAEDEHIGRP